MGAPLTIEAANISMANSLVLMVIALVVFGPRKLPQIGRQVGKLMYEFRKASNDFKFQMEEELRNAEEADRRKREEEERNKQQALNPPAEQAEAIATETASAEDNHNDPYDRYSAYVQDQEEQTASVEAISEQSVTDQPVSADPTATATAIEASQPPAAETAAAETSAPTAEAPAAEQTASEPAPSVISPATEPVHHG